MKGSRRLEAGCPIAPSGTDIVIQPGQDEMAQLLGEEEEETGLEDVLVCPGCETPLIMIFEGDDDSLFGPETVLSLYCQCCADVVEVFAFRSMFVVGMAS